MVSWTDIFFLASIGCRLWDTQLLREKWQIQIVPIAICFQIFIARVNIQFIIKVYILVLIKWSCRFPPPPDHVELRMVSIFWACSPIILLVLVLRCTPNMITLKYRCPYYCCVQFNKEVYIYTHTNDMLKMDSCVLPSDFQLNVVNASTINTNYTLWMKQFSMTYKIDSLKRKSLNVFHL